MGAYRVAVLLPWFAIVLVPSVALVSTWLAILIVLIILAASFFNDESLVCVSLVFSGFHGILQLNDLNFFGSIIDVVLSLLMLLRMTFLLSRGFRFPASPIVLFLPLFIGVIVSAMVSALDKDFFYLGLVAKDFVAPLCAFFYFALVFHHKHYLGISFARALKFLVLGVTTVGFFSLLNYVFAISESFSRFVLTSSGLEEHAARRELAGLAVIRMNSLFVLSTQGAASCLYAIALALTIASRGILFPRKRTKYGVLIILLVCGVVSVSMTFWLTIATFWVSYFLGNLIREGRVRVVRFTLISSLLVVFIISVSLLTLKADNKELSILGYGYDAFIEPAVTRISMLDFKHILVGIGPYPKLYLAQMNGTMLHDSLFKLVYDNWLFGIVFQLGLITGAFFFFILIHVFRSIVKQGISETQFLFGIVFLSLVGFSHGTFLIDRLFIFKAVCLLAASLVALSKREVSLN